MESNTIEQASLFQQYLDNLEFPKLLELLETLATFEGGRREIGGLKPVQSRDQLERVHRLVDEIRRILERGEDFVFSSLEDVQPVLELLGVENTVLPVADILRLHELVAAAVRSRRTLLGMEEKPELIVEFGQRIPALSGVAQFITDRVDPNGEIPDRASPELAAVRRSLRALNEQIHQEYQRVLERAARKGILQDNYITVRNNRFVVPVRADSQGAMRGVVHGSSSSGLTVYLEPFDMVPLNNRFIGQLSREEEIIQEILAQISAYLRARRGELEISFHLLSLLDSFAARARFAIRHRCIVPKIVEEPQLVLDEARHPLLEQALTPLQRTVVPISLELGAEKPCLIISGPNTGGKTAALKTAGLLVQMAQAGIPVPARNMSCAMFHHVFAAIGDQQSLAGDLSTFSSHVLFLRHMLENYRHPSLVLVDELGTGTDPEEGSALAMAFLDHFQRLGAPVIVTTHAQALKEYALTTAGVATAAVEINPETLEPTFRLHLGMLGGSNGLFIARKLGLSEAIIDSANRRLSRDSRLSEEVLRKLNALVHQREEELATITRLKHDHILKKIALERQLEEKKRSLNQEVRQQFETVRKRFEAEKKEFFAELAARAAAVPPARQLERQAEALIERMAEGLPAGAGAATPGPAPREPLAAAELRPGLPIFVEPLQSPGTVLEIGGDGVLVLAGEKKFRVPPSWLRRLPVAAVLEGAADAGRDAGGGERPDSTAVARTPSPLEADTTTPDEIKLIGMTVDEALPELDRFLDAAFRGELRKVAVIHGLGKGILRNAVHQRLREVPFVRHFYHPPYGEGGEGKTVVELDV